MPDLSGVQVMARAWMRWRAATSRCWQSPAPATGRVSASWCATTNWREPWRRWKSALALELAHGYVSPIDMDREVGLLAVVGEGMRGTQGLAGRIFTAISRENVNIIAIAQGSSELTIAIVVRREGLEKAVRAVHAECHL